MRGALEKPVFKIIFWSRGLKYCRDFRAAGYALSRQLPNNELPDMPFPGN